MRNMNCRLTWVDNKSGKVENCLSKTKYSGDVWEKAKDDKQLMPMIDFEFCEEHYQEGINDPSFTFKNVKKIK